MRSRLSSTKIYTATTVGIDAFIVEIEVDTTPGLHFFNIVGLPDKTIEESKDRIAAAIKNAGFVPPKKQQKRIIVNLAPSNIKKRGSHYDLPIAIAYLIATSQIKAVHTKRLIAGELSLDGVLRPIRGILSFTDRAKQEKYDEIIVPAQNAPEASIIDGINVIAAQTLSEVIQHITVAFPKPNEEPPHYHTLQTHVDDQSIHISDVIGQENAKRALLIAASGGHNILMHGPPGSGKSMLARALPSILPPMTREESIEVTKIHSISGTLHRHILTQRPFRAPHHSASAASIIGGGSNPRPGEVTLAHRGVLFLDELPEFPRHVIEALREPLENGIITIARSSDVLTFPARCIFVAAMNPCQCGNYGGNQVDCICSPISVQNYQKKLSGPLLDRIDIQITVPRETYRKQTKNAPNTHTANVVAQARSTQLKRYASTGFYTNGELPGKFVDTFCKITSDGQTLLEKSINAKKLSFRAAHKAIKVARTIADIDQSTTIESRHIAEALGYRISIHDP